MKTSSQEYTDLLRQRYLPGRRIYLKYLIYPQILKRLQTGSVLDMGCGFGEFLKYLVGNGVNCLGIDSNEEHVKICRTYGLDAQVGNILSFKSEKKFKNVILDNVMEHLDLHEIGTFLKNIKNNLSPSGRLIVICPCRKGQSRDPTHKTYITKNLIEDMADLHDMTLAETVNMPTPFEFLGDYLYLQMRMFILDIKG